MAGDVVATYHDVRPQDVEVAAIAIWQMDSWRAAGRLRLISWEEAGLGEQERFRGYADAALQSVRETVLRGYAARLAELEAGHAGKPCDLCDGKGVNMHDQLWPGRVRCRACKGTGVEPATPPATPVQPTASVEAGGREFLLFTSYCGGDNPDCSDAKPCPSCLGMSNVFRCSGPMTYVRELAPEWNNQAPPVREDLIAKPTPSPAPVSAPATEGEVVKLLGDLLGYLRGGDPRMVAGGHRNDWLRSEIERALSNPAPGHGEVER